MILNFHHNIFSFHSTSFTTGRQTVWPRSFSFFFLFSFSRARSSSVSASVSCHQLKIVKRKDNDSRYSLHWTFFPVRQCHYRKTYWLTKVFFFLFLFIFLHSQEFLLMFLSLFLSFLPPFLLYYRRWYKSNWFDHIVNDLILKLSWL